MPAVSTTTGVGFSIKVTGITGLSFDGDSRQNVKKRIANILYLHEPPPDATILAYVGTEELNADKSLHIGDRSDRLFPNSREEIGAEFIYVSSPVGVSHRNILMTQRFATSTASDIPLYFKHMLATTVQAETIRILDKNFEEVSRDHYLVEFEKEYDENTGALVEPIVYTELSVYNSLENGFNSLTGEYTIYYLQYKDTWNNVNTVLLDNQLAYREATIYDIWIATGNLAPWAKAYVIEEAAGTFYVKAPANGKFAIKYTAESKIYVAGPVLADDTSLWLPRVANGSFTWAYGGITGLGYTYSIAEFNGQSFNPIEPYKLTSRSRCTKVADNILKLAHEDIETGDLFQSLSIVIESDGGTIYAFTTDTSLVGSRYRDFDGQYTRDLNGDIVEWSSTEIVSLDRRSGIVHLDIDIRDTWGIFATYNYKEKFYEVSSVNMNPVFDGTVHKQIRVLYIVPKSLANNNSGTQTGSIKWLTVGPDGLIETINQDGQTGNENYNFDCQIDSIYAADGYRIHGHIGLHYNWRSSTYLVADSTLVPSGVVYVESTEKFPRTGWGRAFDGTSWRYFKFIDKTDTTLVLSSDDDGAGGSFGHVPTTPILLDYDTSQAKLVEVVNFIDEHCTSTSRNASDEQTNYGGSNYPNCFHQYFVIADLAVNPPHGIHDAVVLDVREDGGGILPDMYEEAKLRQPEAQWYFDYMKYNGQPHPGNATIVVKLPVELLDTFTEKQIAAIIEDNIPFGIKPLIRYYGYEPDIIHVGP